MEFLETFAAWLASGHPIVKMVFAASPLVALLSLVVAWRKDQDWKNARDSLRDERLQFREDLREFRLAMEASTTQLTHFAVALESLKGRLK